MSQRDSSLPLTDESMDEMLARSRISSELKDKEWAAHILAAPEYEIVQAALAQIEVKIQHSDPPSAYEAAICARLRELVTRLVYRLPPEPYNARASHRDHGD
jgi:hypothetical protein